MLIFITRAYDNRLPQHFSNLFLQIKFGDIVTRFRLDTKISTENNEEVMILDLIKLHYLFTNESKSLEKLIKSDILEIRITVGDKFNEKVICGSKCECLLGLPSFLPIGNALYTKKQIFLFDSNDYALINLSVYLGLSCDKVTGIEKIKVSLNKHYEVYIPEMHYMSVDPLPIE